MHGMYVKYVNSIARLFKVKNDNTILVQ